MQKPRLGEVAEATMRCGCTVVAERSGPPHRGEKRQVKEMEQRGKEQ